MRAKCLDCGKVFENAETGEFGHEHKWTCTCGCGKFWLVNERKEERN